MILWLTDTKLKMMNRTAKLILIAAMGIFFTCQQKPVEIYLAPNGDDNANGTKENPVKTIEKARELAGSSIDQKEVNIIFEVIAILSRIIV